ncbi:type II toxin-antitoxin system VapC family toxin [Nocardia macrotermitis]|uniref:Ribonuclease VapC n=1 Tax=Nocardia macrotermitis TaxID=2585198 RepID=A0A7K0D468_9NOCA|nr:type II toxin-antitoxin system VapC family toxin [Nocardia macrotermitis]MQY20528.1 Toxin FitB [Nocardia macrotermitis]
MIILDTNVISEPLRRDPDPRVADWIDAQNVETLYLSAVTVGELRYGAAAMPVGRRRTVLLEHLESRILPLFTGRILPYDLDATARYARLMATARAAGLAIATADGMIAATAAAAGFIVATRDTGPFEAAAVPIINPWQ